MNILKGLHALLFVPCYLFIDFMLAIRLQRIGRKKSPSYRVVISENARDTQGRALEILGHYNPVATPKIVELKVDRIKHWLAEGAQASEAVHNLLVREGIVEGGKQKSVSISNKRQEKINKKKTDQEEAKKAAKEKAKAAEEEAKAAAESAKEVEEAAKADTEAEATSEAPAESEVEDSTEATSEEVLVEEKKEDAPAEDEPTAEGEKIE
jgi:small subunit ribosomal protein S16